MTTVTGTFAYRQEAHSVAESAKERPYWYKAYNGWNWFAGIVAAIAAIEIWHRIDWSRVWDCFEWIIIQSGGHRTIEVMCRILFEVLKSEFLAVWLFFLVAIMAVAMIKLAYQDRYQRKAYPDYQPHADLHQSVWLSPDGLSRTAGGVTTSIQWPSVLSLYRDHDIWIFLVPLSPVLVPRRFFADITAERAFVGEALSYMTEAARARSKGAVKFVNGG